MNASMTDARLSTSSASAAPAWRSCARSFRRSAASLKSSTARLMSSSARVTLVDPLAIDRAIETRAEGVDVRVQAGQQDVNLLIAGTSRLLLCRRHGTDTCERQHHGERTDL